MSHIYFYFRTVPKLISNLTRSISILSLYYYSNTCHVFGSMHLLCIIYTYVWNTNTHREMHAQCCYDVNDVALNQINVWRSTVVSRYRRCCRTAPRTASSSSSSFSSSSASGETAAEMIFAIQRTPCNVFSRASERASHRKRSNKTGDTPIGYHGENSEITDIACGNKPSLECREGGCALRVSPTETKEQPLGGSRCALISPCIFGRVAIPCTRQYLVVHRQIPCSISRHSKQVRTKQTRKKERKTEREEFLSSLSCQITSSTRILLYMIWSDTMNENESSQRQSMTEKEKNTTILIAINC